MIMNRITQFSVSDRSLSPAEAEIWILADAETVTPTTELRGRLVGPTCPYSTTIEVAYPFRPFAKTPPGLPPFSRRVNVPEPSFWDPIAPFLYVGIVELWQDGQCCDRRTFRHGFREARIDGKRVIWNGREISLSFADRSDLAEADLPALRIAGVNALVLPGEAESLWRAAERLGFAVIGRAAEPRPEWLELTKSAACLGWVVAGDWPEWQDEIRRMRRWIWNVENDPSRA
jgi:hypothetical protein